MARPTPYTRVIMQKGDDWKAVKISVAETMKPNGWNPVGVSESPAQAQQMIVGIRSQILVETLLKNLPDEAKTLIKTEIAQIATEYHNNMNRI